MTKLDSNFPKRKGYGGGRVAEWSVRWTRNPGIPGSGSALALAGFVLGPI